MMKHQQKLNEVFMRSIVLMFALLFSQNVLFGAAPEFSMPVTNPGQNAQRTIRLQLEIAENDTHLYGLQQSALLSEITSRLTLAQVQVKNDPGLPQLTLRVKSIEADRVIATFVQLFFSEPATLIRNNSNILALTWSQATLIAGPKEDMTKEVTQSVVSMVNSFVLDYQKAITSHPTN
jgi:hypothetical protein